MLSHQENYYRLRPVIFSGDQTDLPFLQELYADSRQQEMALTGWTQDQTDSFLQQQFEAQHRSYTEQFTDASFNIILGENGTAIGRLYVEEGEDDFWVEFRSGGYPKLLVSGIHQFW